MTNALNAATAKMQSIVQQQNLPIAKGAHDQGIGFFAENAVAIGAITGALYKFKGMIQDSVSTLVDSFSAGFDKMKGIIIDTVGAFRPFEIEMFNRAIMDLKAVFGTMFLPILQQVTKGIREIANYFYSLPDAFKDTIAGIGKLTLVSGGIAVVVAALMAAGAAALTVAAPFITLGIALAPLWLALSPVLVPLAAITALFVGLGAALIAFNWKGIVRTFEQIWAGLEAAAQVVWDQLKPIWNELKQAFSELSDQLGELFDAFKPILGAALLIGAIVIKTTLQLLIEGLKLFVEGLTWIARQVNSVVRLFGLSGLGFNLPDVSRPDKSAFGLGQHGGSVTDPVSAFKSMQEDILKFSGQSETGPTGIDLVATHTESMARNMDFIVQWIRDKFSGQNEGESDVHAVLRKGPVRFAFGKIF